MRAQRGVALLVVLFIVALMTSIAVSMSGRLFVNFNRIESQLRYEQAFWYNQGVELMAKTLLKQVIPDEGAVTLAQDWAVKDRTYPVEGATVKGSLFDRQACFNLNAFVTVKATENSTTPHLVSALQQLLVSQEIDSSDAETIAASTWEFIDTDTEQQSALGVEDSEYESRTPGYVTPNGMLGDSTEWRAVYGVTKDIMRKVGHFLCALPSDRATLNVNTLTEEDAPILAAMLHPQISVDQAKTLISQRDPVGGWRDIEAFWAEPVFANMEEDKKQALREFIDVRSKFFELDSTVTIDSARLRFRALLKRDDNNGEYTVVRRRFGGVSERNSDDKAEQR